MLLWLSIFVANRRKLVYPTFILCASIIQGMGWSQRVYTH